MTINGRHRKHYKAGSVLKPGETLEQAARLENWWNKVKHLFQNKDGSPKNSAKDFKYGRTYESS